VPVPPVGAELTLLPFEELPDCPDDEPLPELSETVVKVLSPDVIV
jgi:hypothetical protein